MTYFVVRNAASMAYKYKGLDKSNEETLKQDCFLFLSFNYAIVLIVFDGDGDYSIVLATGPFIKITNVPPYPFSMDIDLQTNQTIIIVGKTCLLQVGDLGQG